MRRMAWVWVALGGVFASAAPASAYTQTYFGFHIGITNAPPPHVVFYDEPVVTVVPGYPVYVVDDYPYDMFRYGHSWYLCDDGYWYRARSYRGPFVAVDVRYVPRTILYVPANHWKHRYARGSWSGRRHYYDQRWRDHGRRDWSRRNWDRRDRDWRADQNWRSGRDRDWRGNRDSRGDRDQRGNRDWRGGQDRRGSDWRDARQWRGGRLAAVAPRDYRSRDGGRRSGDWRDGSWRNGDRDGRGRGEGKGNGKGKGKHKDRDRDG